MTDKRIMKVTEAVFERMDSRIATELAGAYDAWISFGFCVSLGMLYSVLLKRFFLKRRKAKFPMFAWILRVPQFLGICLVVCL